MRAAPILASRRLPASVFVTTSTLEPAHDFLPADAWYATLASATRQRGVLGGCHFNLTTDYMRFIDGSERRHYLRAPRREQTDLLPVTQHPPGHPGRVRDLSDAQHVEIQQNPSHCVKVN